MRLRIRSTSPGGAPATNGNPAYEEITCVGYDTDHEELHAIVAIKQVAGYMGDVCSPGSPESSRTITDSPKLMTDTLNTHNDQSRK